MTLGQKVVGFGIYRLYHTVTRLLPPKDQHTAYRRITRTIRRIHRFRCYALSH